MAIQKSHTVRGLPEGCLLSEDEARMLREILARKNFGITLDEFIEA